MRKRITIDKLWNSIDIDSVICIYDDNKKLYDSYIDELSVLIKLRDREIKKIDTDINIVTRYDKEVIIPILSIYVY